MALTEDDYQLSSAAISTAETDCRGWVHAWADPECSWRGWSGESRPRVYYDAKLRYKDGDEYFAVDGLGRRITGRVPYECTINSASGKFQRLCVQTRDSYCKLPNSPWDRTCIRNAAPKLFRVARFALAGIPPERRNNIGSWTGQDWLSVAWRWVPASLGVTIILFLQRQGQPLGKELNAYLPFLYNGYRYPRLARNFRENREDVQSLRPDDPSWPTGNIGIYRVLRPRYLCYLTKPDEDGVMTWFEARPVPDNDNTPYVFISYTKAQFRGGQNYNHLFLWAIHATQEYAKSINDEERRPRAFWLDTHCLRILEGATDEERRRLADQAIYSMSDVIRGAEHTVVLARRAGDEMRSSSAVSDTNEALREWGDRVWTLPEVLLSKGDTVTVVVDGAPPTRIRKLQLAQAAWTDVAHSRQLVEHFTNLHLTRLELVSIALRCLKNRKLELEYQGDRSYALMGLLRVRPGIDSTDSSFQAFARLSLPQDNDRLMERLICLLPNDSYEPWDKMSDQYKSTLWDIYPDTQVCGIGENDTIIIDGFKGAMIQWSMFSTVQTTKRMTWFRFIITLATMIVPILFFFGIPLVAMEPNSAFIIFLVIPSVILLATPFYVPCLYTGKLTEAEPCLFGVEGYLPLPLIEEMLFGERMDRITWSAYGSPLSRHRYRHGYRERHARDDVEGAANQPFLDSAVYTYPVEALDPCSPCPQCVTGEQGRVCTHPTTTSVDKMSRSPFGEMKVFTLIDTHSMTATLFEAYRPPVMLMIGGSEGGMKRALACSYDVATGTLYRETVLRIPSRTVDCMHSLQRVRLGLKNPRTGQDVEDVSLGSSLSGGSPYGEVSNGSPPYGRSMNIP
ncbi:uncharacterized protein Z518_10927 [Rhinocladiella mackenziei CBS 650.93]|uniref:3-hydroxyisobutyrate dehydrogenase protein n=1 Tax=Rhinocladiella mackenziei CBS 650.93 TaxID=1442369 RepID=A0A0D2ITG8_9EURO|nr:uncharacterized protein Z518_10927 [Rhinocladiella mackenziei CBS 650.93]KIW99999.1 hypothetical protein Z518_10927 [Rhinocladiella mackenziei CBS 650.93]